MKIDRHFDAACQAWEYADEELHGIVLLWIFDHGFNLASFDDWIEDAGTAPARRAQLLQWRQHAIDAERTGNHAAAEMGVRFLAELHKRHLHESVLIPPARLGAKSSAAHTIAASAPRKLWPADIKKIRGEYDRRMAAGEVRGAISDLAAQYEVSTKTITRHVKPKTNGT